MTSIDQLISITRELSLYDLMFVSAEGQLTNSELDGSKRYSKIVCLYLRPEYKFDFATTSTKYSTLLYFRTVCNLSFCLMESSD